MLVSDHDRDMLRARHIYLNPGHYEIPDEFIIEAPGGIFGGIAAGAPIFMGAFSYSYSEITDRIAYIGRYCSIAKDVVFGEVEHPTEWLGTSTAFYDPGFIWRDYLDQRAKDYRHVKPELKHDGRIRIGNDVWIGAEAYIRQGVDIGTGAIIGTRAVVTKSVPPYAVVVGNPGRIVKYRFPYELIERLIRVAWWRYSYDDIGVEVSSRVPERLSELENRVACSQIEEYVPTLLNLKNLLRVEN